MPAELASTGALGFRIMPSVRRSPITSLDRFRFPSLPSPLPNDAQGGKPSCRMIQEGTHLRRQMAGAGHDQVDG